MYVIATTFSLIKHHFINQNMPVSYIVKCLFTEYVGAHMCTHTHNTHTEIQVSESLSPKVTFLQLI